MPPFTAWKFCADDALFTAFLAIPTEVLALFFPAAADWAVTNCRAVAVLLLFRACTSFIASVFLFT